MRHFNQCDKHDETKITLLKVRINWYVQAWISFVSIWLCINDITQLKAYRLSEFFLYQKLPIFDVLY